jgi:hypothetical protein
MWAQQWLFPLVCATTYVSLWLARPLKEVALGSRVSTRASSGLRKLMSQSHIVPNVLIQQLENGL